MAALPLAEKESYEADEDVENRDTDCDWSGANTLLATGNTGSEQRVWHHGDSQTRRPG
jgi:hypothetical protein